MVGLFCFGRAWNGEKHATVALRPWVARPTPLFVENLKPGRGIGLDECHSLLKRDRIVQPPGDKKDRGKNEDDRSGLGQYAKRCQQD
jgi:hypothetical protein